MLKFIKYNRQYVNILALWFIAGFLFSPALYVLVPATIFTLSGRNKYLIMFLGFWFILILSDARGGFSSAATVKIIYLLILLFFALKNKKILSGNNQYKVFIPFIGLSFISLVSSPVIITAVQKTLSYFLILFLVPTFVSYLIKRDKEKFLLGLVYTGVIVLFLGFIMRFIVPDFATMEGRFSGVFANPNGLGIYSVLFVMMWSVIKFNYPYLFSKRDKFLINGLIIIAVIFSASRGALLAVTMFYVLDYSVRKKNPFIIVGVILVFISFMFIDNIIDWLYSIGLGKYLRAQTLEKGGGRLVAYEYAWEQIKLNPIFGKGFYYSEYWFHLEDVELILNAQNHQGGTHNSYLTILMDTGFVGFFAFIFAWGNFIAKAIKLSAFGFPILIIVIFSSNIETWLAGSLNPYNIILIITLSLLTNKIFLNNKA